MKKKPRPIGGKDRWLQLRINSLPCFFYFCFLSFILKVEDSWKQTEFIVLPHRESKDVFILGGIDDIQALLDDSMVNLFVFSTTDFPLY